MEPAIAAAGIAAVTSLLLGAYNAFLARQQHERVKALENHKAELDRVTAADKAKLDYEYDARRKLYSQFEPNLFQLLDLAEYAATVLRISLMRSRGQRSASGKNSFRTWVTALQWLHRNTRLFRRHMGFMHRWLSFAP